MFIYSFLNYIPGVSSKIHCPCCLKKGKEQGDVSLVGLWVLLFVAVFLCLAWNGGSGYRGALTGELKELQF
jgi:hypothetical protein